MGYPVKWMHSGMGGAPGLSNDWGSLTALLDACLVTGFGLKNTASISRSGNLLTLSFGAVHGFSVAQIVELSDAGSFTGLYRVISATATTLGISAPDGVPGCPVSATVKTAPVGMSRVFSGQNKRVFQTSATGSGQMLHINDDCPDGWNTSWAKFARVTLTENMMDVDNFGDFRAPFDVENPEANDVYANNIAGWAKWTYATVNASLASAPVSFYRNWVLIGDADGFYLFIAPNNDEPNARTGYYFGDIYAVDALDMDRALLVSTLDRDNVNVMRYAQTYNYFGYSSRPSTDISSGVMKNQGWWVKTKLGMILPVYDFSSGALVSGLTDLYKNPNLVERPLLVPLAVIGQPAVGDASQTMMRGTMRGCFGLPFASNHNDLQVVGDTGDSGNSPHLIVHLDGPGTSNAKMAFDLGAW